MADYYDIESKGDGSYTVTPRDNPGCFSVIGFILFVLIIGFFVTRCDSGSSDSSSNNQANTSTFALQTPQQTTQEVDLGYIWLTDLSPINNDRLYAESFYDTTSNVGSELTHCLRTGTMSYGGSGEGWIEYYIDGDYKYLTGCMAITQDFFDTKYIGTLIIYADGTEIYRVDEMIAGDTPINFQINVSNVERIRIEHQGGEPFRVANLKLWSITPTEY